MGLYFFTKGTDISKEIQTEQQAALQAAREQVAAALGAPEGKKVQAFHDGGLYIEAVGRAVWAWVIDFVLIVGLSVALGLAYLKTHPYEEGVEAGTGVIIILLVLVLPFVYGWFFGHGRGLGGVIAGTRLVRAKDGSKIGFGAAGWAVFARFWAGIFLLPVIVSGTAALYDSPARVSIDISATRRLHAAGFTRLDA